MFAKSKWFIAGLALAFAFVFTGCGDLYSAAPPDPAMPEITQQPVGGTYTLGASGVLTVIATASNGDISYQWYEATDEEYMGGGGRPIGTGASYTISLEEGAWQVYVVVTNKSGAKTVSVKSDLVRILINDPRNAFYPEITTEPASIAYNWPNNDTIDPISVTVAQPSDGGTLSYQWYSVATYTTTGGTIISGGISASFTPTVDAPGTTYYYVVITNTKPDAPGRTQTSVTSSPAVIKAIQANATITVSGTKNQYVRGFGVMVNFWGNSPQDSIEDYELMLNPKKLGYNMLRIMIPVVPEDQGGATEMKEVMKMAMSNQLSGERKRDNYFDIVKLANKYNGFVLASPWSPPPSWKTNGSYKGGGAGAKANLKKQFWQDYADYLKDYCKIMYDNGAPIYVVSIQNEPNFEASYDGCEWSDNDMRDFFKMVGSFTEGVKGWGGGKEIPRVLIMNGESANSPTINDAVLNDAQAKGYVDLYARHLYGSQTVSRSSEVQAQGKEIWMTEHNINSGEGGFQNDSTYNYMWKFLNDVDVSIRINKENAFIWWYGKRFYSMIGDGDSRSGTVEGTILPRGYAMSHYAKYAIDTDQVELSISGSPKGGGTFSSGDSGNFNNTGFDIDRTHARATAFLSRDGNSLSLVLFTPTKYDGTGGIDLGDVRINFPAGFVATKVTAMRSKGPSEGGSGIENMGKADAETVLLKGGTAAFINLPLGQILSVKFTK